MAGAECIRSLEVLYHVQKMPNYPQQVLSMFMCYRRWMMMDVKLKSAIHHIYG